MLKVSINTFSNVLKLFSYLSVANGSPFCTKPRSVGSQARKCIVDKLKVLAATTALPPLFIASILFSVIVNLFLCDVFSFSSVKKFFFSFIKDLYIEKIFDCSVLEYILYSVSLITSSTNSCKSNVDPIFSLK